MSLCSSVFFCHIFYRSRACLLDPVFISCLVADYYSTLINWDSLPLLILIFCLSSDARFLYIKNKTDLVGFGWTLAECLPYGLMLRLKRAAATVSVHRHSNGNIE